MATSVELQQILTELQGFLFDLFQRSGIDIPAQHLVGMMNQIIEIETERPGMPETSQGGLCYGGAGLDFLPGTARMKFQLLVGGQRRCVFACRLEV